MLPEIVTTRENGYKAVQYEKLVALLIESNKELLSLSGFGMLIFKGREKIETNTLVLECETLLNQLK